MTFRRALGEAELWTGESVGVEVEGRKILLCNVDGRVSAFDDRCAHQGWPLSRGTLVAAELTCALHGWRYDACTGAGVNPRGVALRAYPVRIADGDILVDVDGD